MASIVEVKNPLTGAVEKVDKLDHTAQEIDDAVERALMYGLGTSCVPIGTQNLDTITKNGWYQFGSDNTSAPVYAGELFVMKRISDGYCTQVISYAGSYSPQLLVRKQTEGTWSPWEWVNPPMALGGVDADGNIINEYRTTERYLGKSVYTMLVDCGVAPKNGESWIKLNSTISRFVCIESVIYAATEYQASLPMNDNTITVHMQFSSGVPYIVIKTTTDVYEINGYHVYATFKYTKTTD